MSVVWRKVWRDLWNNKFRTILVVLSTALGVFALGFVFGASGTMTKRMTEAHKASAFPHITYYTSFFEQEVVDAILDQPGVADVEAQRGASIRWKLEEEDDWNDGSVTARSDYEAQRINLYTLLEGNWPSGRQLAVERLSSQYFDIPNGSTILVEMGRTSRSLSVEGVGRAPQVFPPQWGGSAEFFATEETVAWITDSEPGFNRLNVILEAYTEEGAEEASGQIRDRLEDMGVYVGYYETNDPEVHWAQEIIDGILLILKVLGGLSLALSGFLIINMMNATVAQQIWQIGVMKVVGATRGRVVQLYLAMATIYGLLSFFLAVLPGILASHLLANWMLGLLNIVDNPIRIAPSALLIQAVVGLIVPLLAALVPVIGGARITAHRAISNYGLGAGFGSSWLDRLISRIRRLPRPMALSLRNTFRRKSRIALTLITLTLAGVMFIVVVSVGASMTNTIEVLISDFGFDVLVVFERTYRAPRLIEASESVEGVTFAEVWDVTGATLALDSGEEIQGQLWGIPDSSQLFKPRITKGRPLLPDDDKAILLNNKIAVDHDIDVGDTVTLTARDKELTWTVVGLIVNINNNSHDNFVPFDTLAQETGNANRGAFVMMAADAHDFESHERMIQDLRDVYDVHRLKPAFFQSGGELREQTSSQFQIITVLMMIMAILAGLVGSIGLMSTMSINVVERGREIGVMRSIGAKSAAILGVFVFEGMVVGVLSWLLAMPLSYPGARLFSKIIGDTLFEMPLDFAFPIHGIVLWLVIAVIFGALASLWPALRATQVSVRESLAYE